MPPHLAVIDSHPVQYKAPMYRKLAERGIDFTVHYCDRFGMDDTFDSDFKTQVRWDTDLLSGYEHVFMRNRSLRPSPYSPFGVINPGIWSVVRNPNYDAVLVNGYSRISDIIALLSAKVVRKPVIFRGEADNIRSIGGFKKTIKNLVVPRILKSSQLVLYSCTANKEFFLSYGVDQNRLIHCPSAVDNQYFHAEYLRTKTDGTANKERLGIPSNAKVILFSGRLTKRKNPVDLLRAVKRMGTHENVWVVFVGDGPERSAIERYSLENDLKNVTVTGFVNQSGLSDYYAAADIFVMMSEHDPSPKALQEAMNFSVPVVVTENAGTAQDLVDHGKNGFTYQVGDYKSLASCLDKCLASEDVTLQMGERSFEIIAPWSFESQVEAITEAFERVTAPERKT